jgi:hypothetical protein
MIGVQTGSGSRKGVSRIARWNATRCDTSSSVNVIGFLSSGGMNAPAICAAKQNHARIFRTFPALVFFPVLPLRIIVLLILYNCKR